MHSQSALKMLRGCGLKYRLHYLEGHRPAFRAAPLVVGSIVHRFIAHPIEDDWEKLLKYLWELETEDDPPISWGAMKTETAYARCRGMCEVFVEHFKEETFDYSELQFEADITIKNPPQTVGVRGIVDKLRVTGDSLEIYEFKTGRLPPRFAIERDIQMGFYALAGLHGTFSVPNTPPMFFGRTPTVYYVNLKGAIPPTRGENKGKTPPREKWMFPLRPDKEDLRLIRADIAASARRVELGLFDRTGNTTNCIGCEYREHCPAFFTHDSAEEKQEMYNDLERQEEEALKCLIEKK